MNTAKCKRWRDVWVAPGTQMFEALEAGDKVRADRIYKDCEIARRRAEDQRDEQIFECLDNGVIRLFTEYKPEPRRWPDQVKYTGV